MVDILFDGEAHKFWSKKKYWSVEDVLNIHFGGLENVGVEDYDEVDKVKEKLNQAVAAGELRVVQGVYGAQFKRDDIVLWAHTNLANFPFEPGDFEAVVKKKRPGTDQDETRLRAIGALALLLAHKHKKYQKGEVPNQSGIADTALEILEGLKSEIPKLNGLKSANFREIIRQGLELLTK